MDPTYNFGAPLLKLYNREWGMEVSNYIYDYMFVVLTRPYPTRVCIWIKHRWN